MKKREKPHGSKEIVRGFQKDGGRNMKGTAGVQAPIANLFCKGKYTGISCPSDTTKRKLSGY